jgi:hypothetical protein
MLKKCEKIKNLWRLARLYNLIPLTLIKYYLSKLPVKSFGFDNISFIHLQFFVLLNLGKFLNFIGHALNCGECVLIKKILIIHYYYEAFIINQLYRIIVVVVSVIIANFIIPLCKFTCILSDVGRVWVNRAFLEKLLRSVYIFRIGSPRLQKLVQNFIAE